MRKENAEPPIDFRRAGKVPGSSDVHPRNALSCIVFMFLEYFTVFSFMHRRNTELPMRRT